MKLLQSMAEHRTVFLLKDVGADFDQEVRSDAQNVLVKGCVVDLAQRQTVRDLGETMWVTVRKYVRSL